MKCLISRSGSTVAQVLCILLLLELAFVVQKSNGFAQSTEGMTENSPQMASLASASLAEKSSSPEAESGVPATPAAAKPAITSEEANAISQMLQTSLEAKLKQWQTLSGREHPTAPFKTGDAAMPDIVYVDQKIAALDRMIKLLEQKQSVQTAAGLYQKRLESMRRKIEENGSKTADHKPE